MGVVGCAHDAAQTMDHRVCIWRPPAVSAASVCVFAMSAQAMRHTTRRLHSLCDCMRSRMSQYLQLWKWRPTDTRCSYPAPLVSSQRAASSLRFKMHSPQASLISKLSSLKRACGGQLTCGPSDNKIQTDRPSGCKSWSSSSRPTL